jgi:hypothetical protein
MFMLFSKSAKDSRLTQPPLQSVRSSSKAQPSSLCHPALQFKILRPDSIHRKPLMIDDKLQDLGELVGRADSWRGAPSQSST